MAERARAGEAVAGGGGAGAAAAAAARALAAARAHLLHAQRKHALAAKRHVDDARVLVAQVEQRLPGFLAEEAQDDLTVGERRVVIGNFPKTGIHGGCAFGVSNAR